MDIPRTRADEQREALAALEDTWMAHPELRLGQLVYVAAVDSEEPLVFYTPDDMMAEALRKLARRT